MIIHKVRQPFMSREGQFVEGEHTLVIGLDLNTVKGNDLFRCYIGDNTKTYYEILSSEALRLADEYKSYWVNPQGKTVLILPIKDFKMKKPKKKKVRKPFFSAELDPEDVQLSPSITEHPLIKAKLEEIKQL